MRNMSLTCRPVDGPSHRHIATSILQAEAAAFLQLLLGFPFGCLVGCRGTIVNTGASLFIILMLRGYENEMDANKAALFIYNSEILVPLSFCFHYK